QRCNSRSHYQIQPILHGYTRPIVYLIKNASLFSFRFLISSFIHRGISPRPAQVSFGFALLLYLGGTFRPFIALRRRPPPTSITPSLESWDFSLSTSRLSAASTSTRSFMRASIDIEASLLGRAIVSSHDSELFISVREHYSLIKTTTEDRAGARYERAIPQNFSPNLRRHSAPASIDDFGGTPPLSLSAKQCRAARRNARLSN